MVRTVVAESSLRALVATAPAPPPITAAAARGRSGLTIFMKRRIDAIAERHLRR
jgi:hypothetical protein